MNKEVLDEVSKKRKEKIIEGFVSQNNELSEQGIMVSLEEFKWQKGRKELSKAFFEGRYDIDDEV